MENTAFEDNQINPSQQINSLPTQENLETLVLPPNPIILNPGIESTVVDETGKRSFLGTLSLLFAGWLVGNLVILAIVGVLALGAVGATGLVQVPLLTQIFFGDAKPIYTSADPTYLEEAQEKLNRVNVLRKGEKLASLELTEVEINSLLNNKINTTSGFPIGNQNLKFENSQFVFTGNLLRTNAPIKIQGKVKVDNLTAKVNIEEAKFGKINLPAFIATTIVETSFDKIGLSLSAGSLPAESLEILSGKVILKSVVKPKD